MTEMMMRDWDSLNSTVAAGVSPAFNAIVRSKEPVGIETGFGECDGKSAFGAIVRALNETFTNQITNGILHLDFMCEIDVRWRTDF